MKTLLFAMALICVSGASLGQPRVIAKEKDWAPVTGEGQVLCGTYLEQRAKKSTTQDYIHFTWFRGYLAGRNQTAQRVVVIGLEQAEVLAYLDKHCRDNPLQAVVSGASKLYEEVGGER